MPKRRREADVDVDAGDAPTSIDPYAVLGIADDASADDIKKAYRKAALKHHPDKAAPEDKETAHSKFQEVAFAFAILSDERRRRRYDTTGRTEESFDLEDEDFDWTTYFREQYEHVVTQETINNFANEYKGSKEEREHVLQAYTRCKGSMEKLYENVMLSDMLEDERRFRAIIDQALAEQEVEVFQKYAQENESARQRRMDRAKKRKERERKEAEKAAEELEEKKAAKKQKTQGKAKGDGGLGDLAAMIRRRQTGRAEHFFDSLEEKYAAKAKKGRKKAAMDEPPEEAFAANRRIGKDVVEGGRKGKKAKG